MKYEISELIVFGPESRCRHHWGGAGAGGGGAQGQGCHWARRSSEGCVTTEAIHDGEEGL